MSARRYEDSDSTGTRAATLGDLLYADKTKTVVSEHEWVALVEAIAAGDQLALRELYERANRMVFTLMVRISNSRETAEELTVDVFHDVWRRASTYHPSGGGTVVGWIMNQARSRAIDRLRFEQRKKRVNPYPDGPAPASAESSPLQALETDEHGRRLREALGELTRDERRAIEMAYFCDLTYAETAARLDEPLGTIKTRLRSGLGKLREALESTAAAP